MIRVSDFMSRPVLTAAPGDGVRETFFRMREEQVRHMPVLNGGQLVGMICDHDLRRPDWVDEAPDLSHDYQLDDNLSVGDIMSHRPVTVHTYDPLDKAVQLVIEHGFGALPVLDKGNHLAGIIAKGDLIRALHRHLEKTSTL